MDEEHGDTLHLDAPHLAWRQLGGGQYGDEGFLRHASSGTGRARPTLAGAIYRNGRKRNRPDCFLFDRPAL